MTIQVGDRVKLIGKAKQWTINKNKERVGTITSECRNCYNGICYRVLFDGLKSNRTIHFSFLEKIPINNEPLLH
jgi:hypothetical protein